MRLTIYDTHGANDDGRLSERLRANESGRGLPHSKTLARSPCAVHSPHQSTASPHTMNYDDLRRYSMIYDDIRQKNKKIIFTTKSERTGNH
jgi:hypothetical protein